MARTSTAASKASVRILLTLAFVAVIVYVLDQGTKWLVVRDLALGEDVDVLGPWLRLHFVKNPGAAFSLATGSTWIFSLAAAAVVVAIIIFARRIHSFRWALMLGMLLGGTLGNLTDRLFREPGFGVGHVVDFIYLPWILPAIFNIADTFIVSSMGLLLLLTLLGVGLDGRRASKRETGSAADGPGDEQASSAAVSPSTQNSPRDDS